MANKWVLTANEKARVANATTAYNNSIRAIAASKNLAVADMNAIMNQLVNGLQIETGQIYTANYFSGGTSEFKVLFSLSFRILVKSFRASRWSLGFFAEKAMTNLTGS